MLWWSTTEARSGEEIWPSSTRKEAQEAAAKRRLGRQLPVRARDVLQFVGEEEAQEAATKRRLGRQRRVRARDEKRRLGTRFSSWAKIRLRRQRRRGGSGGSCRLGLGTRFSSWAKRRLRRQRRRGGSGDSGGLGLGTRDALQFVGEEEAQEAAAKRSLGRQRRVRARDEKRRLGSREARASG